MAPKAKSADEMAKMEAERDRNRKMLAQVSQDHETMKGQFTQLTNTVKGIQAEFTKIRQEFGGGFAQLKAEVEKERQLMERQLADMANMKSQLVQLSGDMMQVQLTTQQGDTELKSLKMSALTKQDHVKLQAQADKIAQDLNAVRSGTVSNQELSKLKGQADQMAQELSRVKDTALNKDEHFKLKTQSERIAQDLHKMQAGTLPKEELTKLKSQADRMSEDLNRLKGGTQKEELSRISQELNKLKSGSLGKEELNRLKDELNTLKSNTQNKEELSKINQELSKLKSSSQAKDEISKINQELEKLRTSMSPVEEIARLKVQSDTSRTDFDELKKQIYDRGLLAPVRTEPINEDSPPVGALELCPDVFTARLLLRLGFMKGRIETRRKADEEGSSEEETGNARQFSRQSRSEDSRWHGREISVSTLQTDSEEDSDESALSLLSASEFDNVSGIKVPEVQVGGPGYLSVVCAWPFICVGTLLTQLLILGVMSKTYTSLGHCMDTTPYVSLDWWLIHISRVLAMLVSGSLMTKDLMDIVNFWLVSILLEPRCSKEVAITALARIALTIGVVVANVFLFMSYTDAGFLWVNMAALVFVSALGEEVLGVAKRGVFGHHISKAVTGVSFELSFVTDYPGWFKYVTNMTLMVSLCAVCVLAVGLFINEDPPCGKDESNFMMR